MSNFKTLSRRTFLRGTGVALGLPFLEGMLPSRVLGGTAAVKSPLRTAFIYFPNGVWQSEWIPSTTGPNYQLSPSLKPLTDVKDDVIVLSGLDKAFSRAGDGHYAKTANFLTGLAVAKTSGADISSGGTSVDQLIAQKYGFLTPFPSLELGTEPVVSGIDGAVGYTRLYGGHIAWKTAEKPLAKEINPRFVYERLFGCTQRSDHIDTQFSPLLDFVLDDAKVLRKQLGRDDRFKMDEYLDSVRSVEQRLEFATKPDPREWKPHVTKEEIALAAPGIPRDFREHVKAMLDLMVLAFRTDSTRTITFMTANDVSTRNYSFIDGVRDNHHSLSHHQGEQEKLQQYQKINIWHVEQYAYFLKKLKECPEGESNLLENSMVMMGSSISDGNAHDPNNLPILLAGQAGGHLKTGHHLASPANTPLCNLYVTMMQKLGIDIDRFGDSTGALAGV